MTGKEKPICTYFKCPNCAHNRIDFLPGINRARCEMCSTVFYIDCSFPKNFGASIRKASMPEIRNLKEPKES